MIRVLALSALALACSTLVAPANPLDRDTPECAIARAEPTDGNIEPCTGEPVSLTSDAGPRHWLVALAPGVHPRVTVLDDFETAFACIDAQHEHYERHNVFTACVPLNYAAESELTEANAYEYGMIDGDF